MRYLPVVLATLLISSCAPTRTCACAPPPEAAEPSNSPSSLASPSETQLASDPFREAVNKATTAAQLTQKAKTAADWNSVASDWNEAISLMQSVPESSANHAVAQQKAVEYQKNLSYAQKNAARQNSSAAQTPAPAQPSASPVP